MIHPDLLQVDAPGLAYICLGGFIVAVCIVTRFLKERLCLSEVVLGTVFGILMGPYIAGFFDPREWASGLRSITLEILRVRLATGLFSAGVQLPPAFMKDHAGGLLILTVPTMAFGWVIVAAMIFGLFPVLDYISSLVIAACLTPTDPIICAAILSGKWAVDHVPENLRNILSAESAANDGMAYPFLSISIYLTVESSRRVAIGKWFLVGWLYQVILGTLLGAIFGFAFSRLMNYCARKELVDKESYVIQYLSFAVLTMGIVRTLGCDDLLAAFAAGCAMSWDGEFQERTKDEEFSSILDLLLNCICFVYIGAWLPFAVYSNSANLGISPWRLIVLVIGVMILRRIPSLFLLYKFVPEITSWREALFAGHFGPMGVGAVFVSTLALTHLPTPQTPPQGQEETLAATIQPIVSFVVLCSIIIHGLSIPLYSVGQMLGFFKSGADVSAGPSCSSDIEAAMTETGSHCHIVQVDEGTRTQESLTVFKAESLGDPVVEPATHRGPL